MAQIEAVLLALYGRKEDVMIDTAEEDDVAVAAGRGAGADKSLTSNLSPERGESCGGKPPSSGGGLEGGCLLPFQCFQVKFKAIGINNSPYRRVGGLERAGGEAVPSKDIQSFPFGGVLHSHARL